MEQEVSQEYTEDDLEMVSMNSVCFNKNQLMLTTKLEMYVGSNNMIIPYKIDTRSDGNIMPWYIFKKLFPSVTESQLMKTIKNYINLKMYNKTENTQRENFNTNICDAKMSNAKQETHGAGEYCTTQMMV